MKNKAASTRRMATETSPVREQLVEAAGRIVRAEGYAAVTARCLAEKMGFKRQTVHYYFSKIEDLLIAVIRRERELAREQYPTALESDEPLRALWALCNNVNIYTLEIIALTQRRKATHTEIGRHVAELRRIGADALSKYFELRGIKPILAPVVPAIVVTGMAHTLAMEKAFGVTEGHAETKAFIEDLILASGECGVLLCVPGDTSTHHVRG